MRKGFTVIEMMTVVMILGVFASYFTPKYVISMKKAREVQCLATRENIKKAAVLYSYDHDGEFPTDISVLYEKGYLDKKPYCTEGGTYVWVSTTTLVLACSVHYWPFTQVSTAPVSGGGTLPPQPVYSFASDFNDGSDLYNTFGKWGFQNGFMYNIGSNTHKAFFNVDGGPSSLKDYKLNLTASATIPYGIYYRSDGQYKTNGYMFYYTNTSFRVYLSKNGSLYTTIASVNVPKGFSAYGQSHNIEISVSGNNHSIKVDGKEYLKFTDSRYSSGTGGVYTSGSSNSVQFDAATIEKI